MASRIKDHSSEKRYDRNPKQLYNDKKNLEDLLGETRVKYSDTGIQSTVFMVIAILGIAEGLFFMSFGASNSIMLSPGSNGFNWSLFISIIAFLIGISSAVLWFKLKKKK